MALTIGEGLNIFLVILIPPPLYKEELKWYKQILS